MKKLIVLLLAVVLCILVLALPASAEENLTWSYDFQTETLIISGNGPMPNYGAYNSSPPWKDLSDVIKNVRIESGITTVGQSAFYHMNKIQKVELADTVRIIYPYAFYYCTSLREIRWSQQLMQIRERAFDGCDSLEIVSLPDSMRVIERHAFHGCDSLKTLKLNQVESMGNDAFSDCVSLTDVDFGTLKTISFSAFDGCKALSVLNDTGDVEVIKDYAFSGNKSLRAIRFSSALKEIWDRSFLNCEALQVVVFHGNAPKFMPADAEYDTYGLPDRTIAYYPANDATWTKEARQALGEKTLWIAVEDPAAVKLDMDHNDYTGDCGENVRFHLKNGVLTISGSGSVSHPNWDHLKSYIKKIVIQDGITAIGSDTFNGCSNLTQVTVADSVTVIEDGAFFGCKKLTKFDFPKNLKTIGENTFRDCDALTEVIIPDSVTSIGSLAFSYCDQLRRLVFGTGVQTLGGYVFSNCPELKEPVFLGKAPKSLDDDAFEGYEGYVFIRQWGNWSHDSKFRHGGELTWVVGEGGYSGLCGSHATWKLEGHVLTISGTGSTWDFYNECVAPWTPLAKQIHSVVVENGIEKLGDSFCKGMRPLNSVYLSDSVTELGIDAFRYCKDLKDIRFSKNLKTMKTFAFLSCDSLEKVTMPDSIEVIGYGVFSDCGKLKEVVIPHGVQSVGQDAFAFCDALEHVHFMGNAPAFHKAAFEDTTVTVIYPGLDPTWTNEVLKDYGGKITWQPRVCAGDHSFRQWALINEATVDHVGLERRNCSNCGLKEEREFPKLPKPTIPSTPTTPTEPTTEPFVPDDKLEANPRPSLFSNDAIAACFVMAAVFVLCSAVIFVRIAVLTYQSRKEKENEK